MQIRPYIIHSLSQNQQLSKTKFIIWPLLFGAAFFFFSNSSFGALKIAVVDTGFCSDKASILSKKHQVLTAIDLTKSNTYNCKKVTPKELLESGRFHGQHVLNEFLKFMPKKIAMKITPLIVYDNKGNQTEEAWNKAISFIEDEKFDLVLTASGFITDKKLVGELPSIWFVPSGRTEKLITKDTALFPQSLAPKPNMIVIGDYFDKGQIIYDQALMYQDQIDYYFPSGSKSFQGTSRAVAEAMGRALENCFITKDVTQAHLLRLCLLKKSKTLKDPILKKEFKTF